MSKCDKDHSYNGWPNYETWCASLWMDNDEGSYSFARELAAEAKADYEAAAEEHDEEGPGSGCVHECGKPAAECLFLERPDGNGLADRLKEWFEEEAPDLGTSFYADILNAAMSEVDWQCIAEHILSE